MSARQVPLFQAETRAKRSTLPSASETEQMLPLLSLFSGAGGLDLGFERAGFSPRLAVDIASAAVQTYLRNHPGVRVEQLDLLEVDPRDLVSLWDSVSPDPPVGIVGGPPCQAFSVSNVYQRDDDERASLVDHYARIVAAFAREKGVLFFVFENVPGLLRGRHRGRFIQFCERCELAGFRLFTSVLDAARFGVPQYRKRLFVVGLHRDTGIAHFEFPAGNERPPTVRETIGHLPEPWYFAPGLDPKKNPVHPNHWTLRPRSRKFGNGSLEPGSMQARSFRVLRWDAPSWTVAYGHREVHVHPSGHRRLSVYEALLLQGFPPEYILEGTLSQQITLVSDAVPPPVAEAVARALRLCLEFHGVLYRRSMQDRAESEQSTAQSRC